MDGKKVIFWIILCLEFCAVIRIIFPELTQRKEKGAGRLRVLTLILANVFAFFVSRVLISDKTVLYLPLAAAAAYRVICGKRFWPTYIWSLFWASGGYLYKYLILILEELYDRQIMEVVKAAPGSWPEAAGEIFFIAGLLLIGRWFQKENIKPQRLCRNAWPVLFIVSITGYWMLQCTVPSYRTMTRLYILFLDICALAAFIAVFLAVFVWNVNRKLREERALVEIRGQMLERFYLESHQQYEKMAELNHDVKYERRFLRQCLEGERMEEARQYLAEKENQDPSEDKIWTGIRIIDFMINREMNEWKKKGICFSMESSFEQLPIKEGDFAVLFGNLIENASEAAAGCREGKRWIKIIIRKQNDIFMLNISNSANRMPEIYEGEFKTTKSDSFTHGWGLKNVRRIVEEYDGTINYHYTEQMFEVNLVFWNSSLS